MLVALPDLAAPGERVQQERVNTLVERSQHQPFLEIGQSLVLRSVLDEVFQQRGVMATELTPLRGDPTVEGRAAVDLQAFEKVSGEQRGERSQPLRANRLDVPNRPGDLDRIDEAVRQIKSDGVRLGVDPAPIGFVDQAPDLAETPTKLSARIVGDVPQQLAKLAPLNSVRRKRQICEQPAHLARRRHCPRHAVPADRQRAQASAPRPRGCLALDQVGRNPRAFPRPLPRSPPRAAATSDIDGHGACDARCHRADNVKQPTALTENDHG